ncbi:MAG: PEP-CTERM sorting domain-containing protein [Planctomycetota bacterium]
MRRSLFALLLSLLALSQVALADIQIDGYSDATNDRFTNSGSFILSGYNLSGVGQVSSASGQGRWATLLSPNVVISAWHFPPPTNAQVTFHLDNNPNSTPLVRTVTSTSTRVGGTDLWLGVLDAPVTGATFYQIADEVLSGPPGGGAGNIVNAGSFQDVNSFMFGLSPKNNAARRDQAVGRNRILGYWENVPFNGSDNDSLIMEYNLSSDAEYVQYESHFRGGDSGGPFFIERGGKLLLLGTNAFVLNDNAGRTVASGINYVGNRASTIRDFVNLHSVPEPTSGLLLCGLGAVFFAARRSRA